MTNKIIWALIETVTIALGTGIFATGALYPQPDAHQAGLGAFMAVFGLLLRNWRKDLFAKKT